MVIRSFMPDSGSAGDAPQSLASSPPSVDKPLAGGRIPTTPVKRWNANIEALRTVKDLESSGRQITPEEKAVLSQYSGFGDSAFEAAFAPGKIKRNSPWVRRGEELRSLVGAGQFRDISASRLNAFYTSPEVVRAMWDKIERLGLYDLDRPVHVLEPSAGVGRFFNFQPEHLADKSTRTAIELDSVAAGILKHLYPEDTVYNSRFESAPVPDDHYDVAISNIPFGHYPVHDNAYSRAPKQLTSSIHNYFFVKALDKLRPGGILAFVTSRYTMDAASEVLRKHLAGKADFLGAVRLPTDAFPDTKVVTDIVFLQKRVPGEEPKGYRDWVDHPSVTVAGQEWDTTSYVNRYFAEHPEQVLGKASIGRGMYSDREYRVISDEGRGADNLPQALQNVAGVSAKSALTEGDPQSIFTGQAQEGEETAPSPRMSAQQKSRIDELERIASLARELMTMEARSSGDEEPGELRPRLLESYTQYTAKHGALSAPNNRRTIGMTSDPFLLLALEDDQGLPSRILHERTIGRPQEIVPSSAYEAMVGVLQQTGTMDFERMGDLLGRSAEDVREELRQGRHIFQNPEMGKWEVASRYLSGDVRQKLTRATSAMAMAKEGEYEFNVGSLGEVQPEGRSLSNIDFRLGTSWIPDRYVNQWVIDKFQPTEKWDSYFGRWFQYDKGEGLWEMLADPRLIQSIEHSRWGTLDMGAQEILMHALKGRQPRLTIKNDEGKTVVRETATASAREKLGEMERSFQDWIFADPDKIEELEGIYNQTINVMRPRIYEEGSRTIPGLADAWQNQSYPHQYAAVQRIIEDGTALLAHQVGFGKTNSMILGGMERKRLGLSNKPMYVVPKNVVDNWIKVFRELYPQARLLVPSQKDFTKANREVLLNRMATGNWDGIILTPEQFLRIPVSLEKQEEFIESQVKDLEYLYNRRAEENSRRSPHQKEIQLALKRKRVKLTNIREQINRKTDRDAIAFEDLGVDQLFVDEADLYKNLGYITQMNPMKGMPNVTSQRSEDMLLKVRLLQEQGKSDVGSFPSKGVVFATGTPISNSIVEAWTMMFYLQPEKMKDLGIYHFDAWASSFGTATMSMEHRATGEYKETERFSQFHEIPVLSNIFQNVADIRMESEMPEMGSALPRRVGDDGIPKRSTVVVAPENPELNDYIHDLKERSEAVASGRVKPDVDNYLKITTDARMASLDLRLRVPSASYNPQGKVPLAADNVARIYKEEAPDKGVQIVMLDIGTPKPAATVDTNDEELAIPAGDLAADAVSLMRDVYGVLKAELVARGVADNDIAFIHAHNTPEKRKVLFQRVNAGDIRVLIGSTGMLGVGVNVHERAAALHHIDAPWRPRDITQREGRIVRPGNQVYGPKRDEDTGEWVDPGRGVRIYNYVQQGSFDEDMWQAIEKKQLGITSLMQRTPPIDIVEEPDEFVLTAAHIKGKASSNPLVSQAEELKSSNLRLRLGKTAHRERQKNALQLIPSVEASIKTLDDLIPRIERDVPHAEGISGKPFEFEVDGKLLSDRDEAGRVIVEKMNSLPFAPGSQPVRLGVFHGFAVEGRRSDRGYELVIFNSDGGPKYWSNPFIDVNAKGISARIDNLVKGVPKRLEDARTRLATAHRSLSIYREESSKAFQQEKTLAEGERKLSQVMEYLRQGKTTLPVDLEPLSPAEMPAAPLSVDLEPLSPAEMPAAPLSVDLEPLSPAEMPAAPLSVDLEPLSPAEMPAAPLSVDLEPLSPAEMPAAPPSVDLERLLAILGRRRMLLTAAPPSVDLEPLSPAEMPAAPPSVDLEPLSPAEMPAAPPSVDLEPLSPAEMPAAPPSVDLEPLSPAEMPAAPPSVDLEPLSPAEMPAAPPSVDLEPLSPAEMPAAPPSVDLEPLSPAEMPAAPPSVDLEPLSPAEMPAAPPSVDLEPLSPAEMPAAPPSVDLEPLSPAEMPAAPPSVDLEPLSPAEMPAAPLSVDLEPLSPAEMPAAPPSVDLEPLSPAEMPAAPPSVDLEPLSPAEMPAAPPSVDLEPLSPAEMPAAPLSVDLEPPSPAEMPAAPLSVDLEPPSPAEMPAAPLSVDLEPLSPAEMPAAPLSVDLEPLSPAEMPAAPLSVDLEPLSPAEMPAAPLSVDLEPLSPAEMPAAPPSVDLERLLAILGRRRMLLTAAPPPVEDDATHTSPPISGDPYYDDTDYLQWRKDRRLEYDLGGGRHVAETAGVSGEDDVAQPSEGIPRFRLGDQWRERIGEATAGLVAGGLDYGEQGLSFADRGLGWSTFNAPLWGSRAIQIGTEAMRVVGVPKGKPSPYGDAHLRTQLARAEVGRESAARKRRMSIPASIPASIPEYPFQREWNADRSGARFPDGKWQLFSDPATGRNRLAMITADGRPARMQGGQIQVINQHIVQDARGRFFVWTRRNPVSERVNYSPNVNAPQSVNQQRRTRQAGEDKYESVSAWEAAQREAASVVPSSPMSTVVEASGGWATGEEQLRHVSIAGRDYQASGLASSERTLRLPDSDSKRGWLGGVRSKLEDRRTRQSRTTKGSLGKTANYHIKL